MKDSTKYSHAARIKLLYLCGASLFLLSLLLGVLLGSVPVNPLEALSGANRYIILYVRLPRVLSSLLAGGALALSGVVIQGVMQNRLASPSIVGVNSGAGLAITLETALGVAGGTRHALFSFLGAFFAVMAVAFASKRFGASRGTVILIGVALNSFLGAITNTVTTLDPTLGMLSNDFKMGDFSSATYGKLIPAAAVIASAFLLLLLTKNSLDIISLGEEVASSVGQNTALARVWLLFLAALLAGGAVSLAGLLSFVGLIVPHTVRLLGARSSSELLPLSFLFGGGFVTLSDLLARTLFSPYEIPVGIIMAFLGAPFFLYLLWKRK